MESKGVRRLRRILTAYANYDAKVDYVQGMNFIVAQLLLHSSEACAFWLFVGLLENCEMREVFLPCLPGLYKHAYVVERLVRRNLPVLGDHFTAKNIRAEMYLSEWIFGLFASVVALEDMHLVFNAFFA